MSVLFGRLPSGLGAAFDRCRSHRSGRLAAAGLATLLFLSACADSAEKVRPLTEEPRTFKFDGGLGDIASTRFVYETSWGLQMECLMFLDGTAFSSAIGLSCVDVPDQDAAIAERVARDSARDAARDAASLWNYWQP